MKMDLKDLQKENDNLKSQVNKHKEKSKTIKQ